MSSLTDGLNTVIGEVESVIGDNPLASTGIAAGVGAVIGATTGSIITSKIKSRKTRKSNKRKKVKRKAKTSRTKKKKHTSRTSHRRIRTTKTGQPYIILANGRARFIKKSSARNSRKRKGGRY